MTRRKNPSNCLAADIFDIKVDVRLIKQELKLHRWVLSSIVVMLITMLIKLLLA